MLLVLISGNLNSTSENIGPEKKGKIRVDKQNVAHKYIGPLL
jgi:hypothetical protein